VPVAHETTAGLMAGACVRQTGRPALAVAIKGPGLLNLAPALLSNAYEGLASLSICESYAWEHRGSRRHKWLDHRLPIREFVRGHLGFQADARFFSRCWTRATAEPAGPVHVDIGALEEEAPPPEEQAHLCTEAAYASKVAEVREIATVKSREEAETLRVAAEEKSKAERARIKAEEEIKVEDENKERQVQVAAKNRERVVGKHDETLKNP